MVSDRPSPDLIRVTIFMSTPSGGHPRYTSELMAALRDTQPQVRADMVASKALEPGVGRALTVHRVLPTLRPSDSFSNRLAWFLDRVSFHMRGQSTLRRWLIEHGTPDIVHYQQTTYLTTRYDFWRLKRLGIRVVTTVHNVQWHSFPRFPPRWVLNWYHSFGLRGADALLVHTEALKTELETKLGPGHPPVFVTPHGAWSASDAGHAEVPAADPTRKHVLFFGIVAEYKGVHVLLEAMRRLPESVTLTIAGNPEDETYRQRLKAMIADMPGNRVRFIDRFMDNDEIPPLMIESSILVLPYVHFHAQSGVLHDAIAWKRPVVGTDVGAIGASIREWKIGEVVDANDAAALAAAIERVLEPERHAEATVGLEHAREALSWERTAAQTAAAYATVMASGARKG